MGCYSDGMASPTFHRYQPTVNEPPAGHTLVEHTLCGHCGRRTTTGHSAACPNQIDQAIAA